MNTPAVAFDSPDDFDRHDAARATVEAWIRSTARLPADQPWFRPGAATTKTWVQITGARIEGDYRIVYPAKFVSFDENTTSLGSAPKWDDSDEPETLERVCVCVVPNGAVLKKYSRHEANVYGTVVVPEPTPEVFAGVLATRVDGVSGEIELGDAVTDAQLQDGDAVRIAWAGGYQINHTIGAVTDGTIFAFSGGGLTPEDTELPVAGTAVTVTRDRNVEVAVVMVDVMDASAIVRITSTIPESGTGYFDAYVRQPTGVGLSSMEDGERIWVKNYREDTLDATYSAGAQFVARLPHSDGGRAVYGLAENEEVVVSGSGAGSSDDGSTVGYVCLGPFQTVAQCGFATDGVTPQLEVTTKYFTITATIENGRIRFTSSESDEPCNGSGGSSPPPPPPPPPPAAGPCEGGTQDLELVVPDGPAAGTYTLSRTDPSDPWTGSGWTLTNSVTWVLSDGVMSPDADTAVCDPFALTFLGADFGSAGDLTVGIA